MNNIIFKAIVGSQSYGTSTPTSDIDYKGVYMQSIDDLITFNYNEQINVSADECYYEVRRFLQLLQSANPTVCEILYSPKDCIIKSSPQFDLIVQNRDKFLTKKCLHSFGGYATAQIKRAVGLDKKMNWENKRVVRKTPLDFIYCYKNGQSIPLSNWLENLNLKQEYCGLTKLNHMKDCYSLYYDYSADLKNGKDTKWDILGFKGIVLENSTDIRLSSIPKDMKPLTVVYYNKDGYSIHCKDYKEYNIWLKNRNTQRYVDVKGHAQQIDGKNLLHCRRLIDMAMEIASEGTISVRRPNADYLLSIRKGEVDLNSIIVEAENDLNKMISMYEKSSLPEDCDMEFINNLLLEIRHM